MKKTVCYFFVLLFFPSLCFAWGKRGHEAVGSLAAQLLAKEHKGAEFLSQHTFDMGYYNNAPDLIWKADGETYKKEFSQHFMDLEDYGKIKNLKWNKNRKEFFKKYPQIENRSGRSFWRIQELSEDLERITKALGDKNLKKDVKAHHKIQAEWLVTAGVLGHYIADLAQPLHVTHNYDGELTDQKGIHHWFEETIIYELYPDIKTEAYNRAKAKWAEFHKENKSKTPFDLARELAQNSSGQIATLLKIDKEQGRFSARTSSSAYKELAVERISVGILYLAEIWSRHTGWTYNGERFFTFVAAPEYILPRPDK